MTRVVHALTLLLIVLATAIAPCAPALASSTPCTMQPCTDTAFGNVTTATCCCGGSDSPIAPSHATSELSSPTKTASSFVGVTIEAQPQPMETQQDSGVQTRTTVPLFIRHESLLI